MVSLEDLTDFPGYPMDDVQTDIFPKAQQVRTQSPADKGGDSLISKKSQAIEGIYIGQAKFPARFALGRILRNDENLRAPVEDRCHSRAKYGYGQHGDPSYTWSLSNVT
jgi:hypothetical protein